MRQRVNAQGGQVNEPMLEALRRCWAECDDDGGGGEMDLVDLQVVLEELASNQWQEHVDRSSQRKYYANPTTKATRWVQPDEAQLVEEYIRQEALSASVGDAGSRAYEVDANPLAQARR